MLPQQRQTQQQKPTCPACGNQPQRGSKAGEPICKVCGSGLSTSPLGKRAMKAAGDQAAMKVKQAVAQRQQMQARQQMAQRGMAQGMRPGPDPRAAIVAQMIQQRLRGGR